MTRPTLTAAEIKAARERLGALWGLGRPLRAVELGRACYLGSRDPGQSIRDYETGHTVVSRQVSALIRLYMTGVLPPDGIEIISPPPKDAT